MQAKTAAFPPLDEKKEDDPQAGAATRADSTYRRKLRLERRGIQSLSSLASTAVPHIMEGLIAAGAVEVCVSKVHDEVHGAVRDHALLALSNLLLFDLSHVANLMRYFECLPLLMARLNQGDGGHGEVSVLRCLKHLLLEREMRHILTTAWHRDLDHDPLLAHRIAEAVVYHTTLANDDEAQHLACSVMEVLARPDSKTPLKLAAFPSLQLARYISALLSMASNTNCFHPPQKYKVAAPFSDSVSLMAARALCNLAQLQA